MKINKESITQKQFAFDGCHKIYLLSNEDEANDAQDTGYEILPIEKLEQAYNNSCGLRFISNWTLTKGYASQFEDATFT